SSWQRASARCGSPSGTAATRILATTPYWLVPATTSRSGRASAGPSRRRADWTTSAPRSPSDVAPGRRRHPVYPAGRRPSAPSTGMRWSMKAGVIVPQGWQGEYDGWDPVEAWARTVRVAQQAESLGFESIWLFDHLHTVPEPTDEITFESFTSLSALAAVTSRVRLGHIVICTAFRNPALTAKMMSTMDSTSGGRMDLGLGAGW